MSGDHAIDWEYWASKGRWTIKEAALLLTGLDPDRFDVLPALGHKSCPVEYENQIKITKILARQLNIGLNEPVLYSLIIIAIFGYSGVYIPPAIGNDVEDKCIKIFEHYEKKELEQSLWKAYELGQTLFENRKHKKRLEDRRGAHNSTKAEEGRDKLLAILACMLTEKDKSLTIGDNNRLNLDRLTTKIQMYMKEKGIEDSGLKKGSIKEKINKGLEFLSL